MSYRNLEVWQLAKQLTIDIHKMTLTELPKFEMYEEASQIRRSVKSVRSNIVEGYGRKKYQQEYYKHLVYALGSNDETIDHLEILFETESLKNKELFIQLQSRLETLGKKLNLFMQAIEKGIQNNKLTTSNKQPEAKSQ
ncbi:MAG: four helix bundle protein [Bacteroidia bacterium]|nr:four helix bundle protein [Bacteroidia bacterium]